MEGANKIEAYKTSDGKMFENKAEAYRHQRVINRKAKLSKILTEVWYRGVDMDEVIEHLLENWNEIRRM